MHLVELDFIFSTTRTPTSSVGQPELKVPLAVESIRFNTTSQDLLGRDQLHEVQQVYIQLHSHPTPLNAESESPVDTLHTYDWPHIITTLTQFPSLTRITISCQSRDILMGFARKMKKTLRVVEDMLVLAYFDTVKNESGIVRLEELKTDG